MKRQKKRYSKPYEIKVEIIKLRKKEKALMLEAEKLDAEANSNMKNANNDKFTPGERQYSKEQAEFIRKKALRLRRSSQLCNDIHIPRLSRALAELNTQPMSFLDDTSVIANT